MTGFSGSGVGDGFSGSGVGSGVGVTGFSGSGVGAGSGVGVGSGVGTTLLGTTTSNEPNSLIPNLDVPSTVRL